MRHLPAGRQLVDKLPIQITFVARVCERVVDRHLSGHGADRMK
jgi:hypothetical protein